MAKKEEKSPTEQIKEIKAKTAVKGKELHLAYDSFGEGLEPAYYWVLDYLREDMGYSVEKIYDQFAATEASGFYGELGMRRTALEKRAMEIMQTLGVIVKSVLQLLWDLKEFELRLDHYDKLKSKNKTEVEAARNALKAIWLTEVDIKKGRGSINLLAQDLNFVTIRDAFMVADSLDDAKKLDLNDRVKRILGYKIKEYLDWLKLSEAELRKRYQIEKAWLKSQVSAMKLYSKWARPYLLATKKLFPSERLETGMEELVTAFDVMRIDLILIGQKQVNALPQPGGRAARKIELPDEEKIYSVIETEFRFRSTPSGEPSKGHYTQRGKFDVFFRPYALNGKELEKIKKLEEDEVLQFLEGMTTESLGAMHEEIEKHLKEAEPGEKEKKEIEKRLKKLKFELPFVKEVMGLLEPIKGLSKTFKAKEGKKKIKVNVWDVQLLRELAKKKAGKDCFEVYKIYKDAHKMLKW